MPKFDPGHVRSEDLTLENVPDPEHATEPELWAFVHSFHAYTFWGGMEGLVAALEEQGPLLDTLPRVQRFNLLRSSLFLDLRAARHQDVLNPPVHWAGIRAGIADLRITMKDDD